MNEYQALRKEMEAFLKREWGSRCEIKDTVDFPDLEGKTTISDGRCPLCLAYEKFDDFWDYVTPDE